jgi:HAD superfamily hydrolase (TIGR01490 family)
MSETDEQEASDAPIIAFFDVDNTLLRGASMFHMAKAARRAHIIRSREIFKFAWHQATFLFVGENLKQLGSIKDRAVQIIGGHTEAELHDLANEIFDRDIKDRLWPETVVLTQEHLAKGHQVWLISATPRIVGSVIAERLGLTGALGTEFVTTDGVFEGGFEGDVLHGEAKAIAAEALAERLGARLADCWAYSDSRNDIPLLTMVGHRVVVNPDARLAKHAKSLGWPILELKRASIKEARKRVQREARESTASAKASALAMRAAAPAKSAQPKAAASNASPSNVVPAKKKRQAK